jgi:hypothetical protein
MIDRSAKVRCILLSQKRTIPCRGERISPIIVSITPIVTTRCLPAPKPPLPAKE